jgi:hypothetical protein
LEHLVEFQDVPVIEHTILIQIGRLMAHLPMQSYVLSSVAYAFEKDQRRDMWQMGGLEMIERK